MKPLRIVGLALFALVPFVPAAAVELDLAAAVELALESNPAVRAVEERRREVAAGILEARADAWPQLAAVSSWSRSRNPALLNSPDFEDIVDFLGSDFTPAEQELTRLGVEVSQPLFTWGKISAAVALAEEVAAVAEEQIAVARLDAALAAAEAYYEVLAARRALDTVREQERARREVLTVVEARYEIGEATRLELLQSRATLAELAPERLAAEGEVAQSLSFLTVVLGLKPETKVTVVEPEPAAGPVAPRRVPELDELLARARESRPELADLELQGQALVSQQEVVRADGRPQLELTGRYGREARLVEDLSDALFVDWAVAVGMRWEFFDGGRRRGEIARLESQRRQLFWQRRNLENRIRFEIERAWTDYRTARSRLAAAEVAAEAAREASRVGEESYREGVALQADWIDAQQRATAAEIRLARAVYDVEIEAARLARAVGLMPTESWAEVPAMVAGGVR